MLQDLVNASNRFQERTQEQVHSREAAGAHRLTNIQREAMTSTQSTYRGTKSLLKAILVDDSSRLYEHPQAYEQEQVYHQSSGPTRSLLKGTRSLSTASKAFKSTGGGH